MEKQNWLVAANGSEAHIFRYIADGQDLKQLNSLGNGMRRKQDQDIVTDRPGTISGGGSNILGQSALAPEESPTDRAKEDFAKSVADELEDARRQDKLRSIDIIASPQMLGLLRDKMDKNLQRLIDRTVSKDPSEKSQEELLQLISAK
jgi:protein required for attachment to host cells